MGVLYLMKVTLVFNYSIKDHLIVKWNTVLMFCHLAPMVGFRKYPTILSFYHEHHFPDFQVAVHVIDFVLEIYKTRTE